MKHLTHTRILSVIFPVFLLLCLVWAPVSEASITLAWDPPSMNEDGTPCTDLKGYRIYYGTANSGGPYNGTGLMQGNSPIRVSVSSLSDPSNPEIVLSNLESGGVTYYLVVTAEDTSGNESGYSNEVAAVENVPADNTPPGIEITVPTSASTYSTTSGSLNLGGAASDDTGVASVAWSNDRGGSGMANGNGSWSIDGLSLSPGTNLITVTAYDAAGNYASDTLTAMRDLPDGAVEEIFGEVSGSNYVNVCQDTFVNAGSPDTNSSTSASGLNTYTWPTNVSANHILMKFDLSALPRDAIVNSAVLSLYLFKAGGDTAYELPVHKITGNDPTITHATWNTYDGMHTWEAGGANDIAPAEDSPTVDTTPGYKDWAITEMVQDWAATPDWNYGLMITSDRTASSDSHRYFYPSEFSDGGKRPRLTISYSLPSTSSKSPVANAGADQTVTASQLSAGSVQVTLDGTLSSDPNGDPLDYSWRQTAGKSVNLMGKTAAKAFFSATSALSGESLEFQLRVSDGYLTSVADTVGVHIQHVSSTTNVPPTARISATPSQGTAPLPVTFKGAGSDTDGTITAYKWAFGDGSTSNSQNPAHTYRGAGSYTAMLTVTDNDGGTDHDTQTILISDSPEENVPPTVSINANPLSGAAPLEIQFTAKASDSDGSIASYLWNFGDNTTATGPGVSHTYSEPGEYRVSLRVRDNEGAQGHAARSVSVTEGPPAFRANINFQPPDLKVPTGYERDSGAVFDPARGFGWNKTVEIRDQGNHEDERLNNYVYVKNSESVYWNYNVPNGEYRITLLAGSPGYYGIHAVNVEGHEVISARPSLKNDLIDVGDVPVIVTDGQLTVSIGGSGYFKKTLLYYILIEQNSSPSNPQENATPTLSASASPLSGPAPLTVTFQASASDSDGTIESTVWDFGDGSGSQGEAPTHIYKTPGNYTASVTVIDDDGAQKRMTIPISVLAASALGDQDNDNDGLPDSDELQYGLDPASRDSDNDDIPDYIEWGMGHEPADSDGDGVIDALDSDSDNDGKPDAREGLRDSDGDGAPDYSDAIDSDGPEGDQDRDGISNARESVHMMNPNVADTDGDGIPDGTEYGPFPWPLDSEGDGEIDALDSDSDNDGKPDAREGVGDTDGDGARNYVDRVDSDGAQGDQDQDGIPNARETTLGINPNLSDSDQDGISDADEIGSLEQALDTDGDGIIDAQDSDSDADGVLDSEEADEDLDKNGLRDRLDASTAVIFSKQGNMALQLATAGCRLSETGFLPDPLPDNRWNPRMKVSYGGLQFKVYNVPVGESVKIRIISTERFSRRSKYLKYDKDAGYETIPSTIDGKILSFTLTDGGLGDADHTANGEIEDPGFIVEEQQADTASTPVLDGGGGGGSGGCSLASNPSGVPNSLFIMLSLLLIMIKRLKKSK